MLGQAEINVSLEQEREKWKERGEGSWMLPLPARILILLTFIHGARTCPLGSGSASPVSQDQQKQRRQRQHQQLHVRIIHGTWYKLKQGEPSTRASSCCSGICGLVYSETHALVATSSRKLNVSSPIFWHWSQLACDELHPCCRTLQNRVAAAKLLVGSSASSGSQNLGFAWWGASSHGARLC